VRFVKIQFETAAIADRAYLGMAQRGRVICLPNDQFIVADAVLEWLQTNKFLPSILQRLNQDDLIQTLRNSLAHPV
jgi:hypothetical protein